MNALIRCFFNLNPNELEDEEYYERVAEIEYYLKVTNGG